MPRRSYKATCLRMVLACCVKLSVKSVCVGAPQCGCRVHVIETVETLQDIIKGSSHEVARSLIVIDRVKLCAAPGRTVHTLFAKLCTMVEGHVKRTVNQSSQSLVKRWRYSAPFIENANFKQV